MFKKIILLAAIAAILPFALAAQASPESDFHVELTDDGEGCIITGYVGKGGNVVIPATIQGFPVKEITNDVFNARTIGTILTSITIPDSVITIGKRVFEQQKNLVSVTLSNSLTEISEDAFYHCESLKTIKIPDSVKKIGRNAFSNCHSLESLVLPDSVKEIGGQAFFCTYNLKSVKFPSSHIFIGDDVFEFSGIISVTITGNMEFCGSGVKFLYCSKLETILVEADVKSLPQRFVEKGGIRKT